MREETGLAGLPGAANFKPFDAATGFVNKIIYGDLARENKTRLFLAQAHESPHAIQFGSAALRDHVNGLRFRQQDLQNGKLAFARLESEDILALGESFGPNIYKYRDAETMIAPDISEHTTVTIEEINAHFGIRDSLEQPGFGEALADTGLTRGEFLQRSRSGALKPA